MTILIDLDGTLVNLVGKWLYYVNNYYKTNYKYEEVTNYSFNGLFGSEEFRDFLRIPGFHADLPWEQPEAPVVLRKLVDQGHQLKIASTCVTWEAPRDKYQWIHTHLRIPGLIKSMSNDVFLGGEKQRIRADVIVDDAVHNLKGFPGHQICYDQPWNQEWTGIRAKGWEEVYAKVMALQVREMAHYVSSYHSGGCY